MRLLLTPLACSLLLTISACGGSGGSGNSISINTKSIAITQDNAQQVASTGLSGSESLINQNDSIDIVKDSNASQNVGMLARSVLSKAGGNIVNRKTESISFDCDSGSMKLTVNDANDNQQLDAGDSMSIVFYDCVDDYEDGGISKSNGSLSMKINAISANQENLNVTVNYDDLTITEGGNTAVIDGSATMDVQNDNDTTIGTVSGKKIVFSNNDEAGMLSDFSFSATLNAVTSEWIESVNATMASTAIDGQIKLKTITDLQGVGEGNPTFGELKIEGANGSFVSLNADTGNDDTLLLTIFDGSVTTSKLVNWQELE